MITTCSKVNCQRGGGSPEAAESVAPDARPRDTKAKNGPKARSNNGRILRQHLILLLCIFMSIGPEAAAQDVTQIDGINAKLAHLIKPDAAPPEVQVATLPAVIDWGSAGGNYQFYSVCDDLPKWGPTIASSGNTISGRYFQFLTGIKTPDSDPTADAQQRQAAAHAQHFGDLLKIHQEAMIDGWNSLSDKEARLPFEQRTSFAEFKRQHGAQSTSDEISYIAELGRWQQYVAKINLTTVGRALNNFMQARLTNVMTYSGMPDSAYPCMPLVDLTKALAEAKNHQGPPDLNLKFTHHTARRDESWDSWGGSAGWGPFAVSATHERHDLHTSDTKFSLSLESAMLIKFDVDRKWLDFNLISTYKNAPIYPNSELQKNAPLWGHNGSFALVSKTFVVAYHPKVTLTMSAEDYRLFHESFNGGGSVTVGPFHVDGHGTGGVNIEAWDETTHTVVIGTSIDSFVLLGVINKVMP